MTTTLEAIAQGVAYNLSNREHYIHLQNSDFGMSPVLRNKEQGPSQHGQTDVGFRLRPRTVSLVLMLLADDEDEYFERRDELLQIFAPREDPIQLRLTYGSTGKVRQLDAHFKDDLGFPTSSRSGYIHKVGVALEADDPTWYDPTLVSVPFSLGGGGDAFNVPVAIPLQVGASTLDVTTTVTYDGTWRTSPVVTIVGPITGPIIENTTTGETLDFTGTTISAGQSYTIDTRYGHKTVVDQSGANRIANLTNDSDLATFHLASRTEVSGGLNTIRVRGTGVTVATTAYIQYHTRYLGL